MTEPFYRDDRVVVYSAKCEEALRELPADSVDSVITDPPYGMSVEPDMAEVLRHWLAGDDYTHKGAGFMGRSWDSFVPGPSIWKEIFRVLKPGGTLASFASTRTADMMGIAIRLAGFERRDTILHIGSEQYVVEDVELAWLYGSGFPKEGDLGVAVDRMLGFEPKPVLRREVVGATLLDEARDEQVAATRTSGIGAAYQAAAEDATWQAGAGQQVVEELEPVSEEGKKWQGWSSALKPANEPIILARKPMREKTIAANLVKVGVGAYNIAGAAVGEGVRVNPPSATRADTEAAAPKVVEGAAARAREGRWPANVVVSHAEGCVRIGTESKAAAATSPTGASSTATHKPTLGVMDVTLKHVQDGVEVIEVWSCVPGCQVRAMDVQGAGDVPWRAVRTLDGDGFTQGVTRFLYCPKPTRAEKDAGISDEGSYVTNRAGGSGIAKDERYRAIVREKVAEGMAESDAHTFAQTEMSKGAKRNTHLTVKPISLMEWLIKLLCPPGGIVLDPFMGSGTTGCAAMHMVGGYRFVGCEMMEEHARQGTERIRYWRKRGESMGGSQERLF